MPRHPEDEEKDRQSPVGLTGDLCLIVVAAWLGALLCQLLRLPLVLGYIAAGFLVSPFTWGPSVVGTHEVEMLADLGVALLLFSVGLEFPLPRLSQVGKVALIGAPLQVLLTSGYGVLLGWMWGWPTLHGLWLGSLLALSSTAVALRCLSQNGYGKTLSAQVMIGILVLQDLCSVPILLIMPKLGASASAGPVVLTLLGGCLFVAFWLALGKSVLPRGLARVVQLGNRELFSLTTLALALGIGASAGALGLSLPFGAFLAGLVLAESDFAHQALSDVAPLRDLFTLLFFVSVGMLLDPAWLWQNVGLWLPMLALAWLGKGLLIAGIVRAFGYRNVIPWAAGLYLGQMGELAFVIARLGREAGTLPDQPYRVLLALAAVSMTLTPLLAQLTEPLYRVWRRRVPAGATSVPQTQAVEQQEHTIVVGYGRVGRLLAAILRACDQPLVILEHHEPELRQAKEAGYTVVFGEVESAAVLEAAGAERARSVIFTFGDPLALESGLQALKRLAPETPWLARAVSAEHVESLDLGPTHKAVVAEMEGALEMARQCLDQLGIPRFDLENAMQQVRSTGYRELCRNADPEPLLAVLRRSRSSSPL